MPGFMVGTAVAVNSFTVENNLSTAKTRSEVNGIYLVNDHARTRRCSAVKNEALGGGVFRSSA